MKSGGEEEIKEKVFLHKLNISPLFLFVLAHRNSFAIYMCVCVLGGWGEVCVGGGGSYFSRGNAKALIAFYLSFVQPNRCNIHALSEAACMTHFLLLSPK